LDLIGFNNWELNAILKEYFNENLKLWN
jgi:hypothetical protein